MTYESKAQSNNNEALQDFLIETLKGVMTFSIVQNGMWCHLYQILLLF